MKSTHVNLGKFQDRKTGVNGFILVNFGSESMNHNQLWVDDFEMFESGQCDQFFGFRLVVYEIDIHTVSLIFHRLAKYGIVHQL